MREKILSAAESYFLGKIDFHRINVEVYLDNPVGIGEHSDIMAAVEGEIAKIAEYEEKLGVLRRLDED